MHNRLKVRTTEAQKAAADREKEAKLRMYRSSIQDVFERRSRNEHDTLALKSTEGLLRANPDIMTLWNYRKEILSRHKPSRETIDDELYLTEKCLQVNPKSYSAWYHRNWVLDNVDPDGSDWNRELRLCTKYLKMDERNFHCWDYRQVVASRCREPHENELGFTMEMIESNFSNYSAWHYRSKLFGAAAGNYDEERTKISELSLVESAAFTDPSDQSAWIYQRWLIGKLEPAKYAYRFSRVENTYYLVLNRDLPDGYEIEELDRNADWQRWSGSKIWFKRTENVGDTDDAVVEIVDQTDGRRVVDRISLNDVRRDVFDLNIGERLWPVLDAQLDSLRQLLEMEPESKWALLTHALLLYTLKPNDYFVKCLQNIELLKSIDTLRMNYYRDLESRYRIEYWIANYGGGDNVNLKGLGLTALYHVHMFLFDENIDLTDNDLSGSNLNHLNYLVKCKNLSLRNCQLTNLNHFPVLPNLEVLDLRDNQIIEIQTCGDLTRCESLKTILLDSKQTSLEKIIYGIERPITIKIV